MRAAIVVAGGTGERSGLPGGKQLARVAGEPLVTHSLRAFDAAETIDVVVLVCHPERVDEFRREAVELPGIVKVRAVVPGGDTRRLSVRAGLEALPASARIVAVHDGARPLIGSAVIDGAVRILEEKAGIDGVVVGHPSYDTVKLVDDDGIVLITPVRSTVWMAQTPQVFRVGALLRAHDRAAGGDREATDDAMLVEMAGGRVAMFEGTRWNIKVTAGEDIGIVEDLLRLRGRGGAA